MTDAPFQLFPALDDATEAALRASIERFGVLVPVLVDQHGRIIDGHHRVRIAAELDVPCRRMVVVVENDDDAQTLAAELNLARRHMNREQRQEQVRYLYVDRGMPLTAIAAALGIGVATAWRDAQNFQTEIDAPDGHVVTAADGKIRPRRYEPRTEKEHRTELRREFLAEQRANYDAEPAYATDDIRRGDFRDVFADIEPGSVDLVLTDPPYGDSAVPLYGDLAAHAARWLRPGGSLITYTGQSTLPEVLALMSEHMDYRWTLVLLQMGPTAAAHAFSVFVGWKPILWFTNGPLELPTRRMFNDVLKSENPPDQTAHKWAQSAGPVVPLIEQLTDPGHLIVDPFAGTGRWGAVAKSMGRRWIGADLGGAVIPQ